MLCNPPVTVPRGTWAAILTVALACGLSIPATAADQSMDKQFYEVRTYHLGADGDPAALDHYLSEALLPALKRHGAGPVGALHDPDAPAADRKLILIIPYESPNQMVEIAQQLDGDQAYRTAADSYLQRDPGQPAFQRISSELLIAFDCMPQLQVPPEVAAGKDRIYELRTYESATEERGDVKVEMFNSGEVPIFLDSGIRPVFLGQALVGPQRPNLTYLSVFENDQARQAAWDAFRVHPDWKTLSSQAKYTKTVSSIDKAILVAKPYSQL